jgi:cell division protein FtsW
MMDHHYKVCDINRVSFRLNIWIGRGCMARTVREENKRRLHSYYDYSLLFLILFLVCFGLVMIYSTSSYNAQRINGNATFYLEKQALFAGAGILIMLFVSKIDYRIYITKLPIIRLKPVTILYLCVLYCRHWY